MKSSSQAAFQEASASLQQRRLRLHSGTESQKLREHSSGVKLLLPRNADVTSPAQLSSQSSTNSLHVQQENMHVKDLLY